MAKMHFTSTTDKYNDLRISSTMKNEHNDCAVVAVAIVCGVAYDVAHAELKRQGRRDRKGTYPHQTFAAVRNLGKNIRQVDPREFINSYPGVHKNLKHVTTHHPRRFAKCFDKSKTYLWQVPRHILAVKDGVVHDWSVNKSKQVHSIFEIY